MALDNFPPDMTGARWLASKKANETMMLEVAFAELLDEARRLQAENERLKAQPKE